MSSASSENESKANPIQDAPVVEHTVDERAKGFFDAMKKGDGHFLSDPWMSHLMPHVRLLSTSSSLPHPSATFSFTVQPAHCNRLGNLHGGAAATLFDFLTSVPLALLSRPGYWQYFGVSRTLNVTYLRPAPAGIEVLLECEVVQIGRKICLLRGVMRRRSDGQILSVCEHNKVNVDPEVKL